jgi:hypothetical protein
MLLAALIAIAAQQFNSTQAVADPCHQLLNYIATHPNAGLQDRACDMILAVHTDASCLSKAGGKAMRRDTSTSPSRTTKTSITEPC